MIAPSKPKFAWLFTLTLTAILLPLIGLSIYAAVAFERSLLPQLDLKLLTVGSVVNARLERALEYDIPLEYLPDVPDFFETLLTNDPDLAYLAVTRHNGTVLFQQAQPDTALPPLGDLAHDTRQALQKIPTESSALTIRRSDAFYSLILPIYSGNTVAGTLHIAADNNFVVQQIHEILFDIAIVFVIAALIAFEALPLIIHHHFASPIQILEQALQWIAKGDLRHKLPLSRNEIGRVSQLLNTLMERLNTTYQNVLQQAITLKTAHPNLTERIVTWIAQLRRGFEPAPRGRLQPWYTPRLLGARMVTFLFIFANELSQPFLPLYIRDFATLVSDLPSQILIGLPLTIFTLTAALSMPVGGWRFEQVGCRRTFAEGAALSIIGLAGTGLAFGFYDLLIWRALTAVGYAFMFTACQGYVVTHIPKEQQAGGSALFVSGLMAASICGPAIGGILSDRIGYTATFGCALILTMMAALVAFKLLDDQGTTRTPPRYAMRDVIRQLLVHPRFILLMLFAAIPAKIVLNGFLFFLVPLTLSEFGDSRSEIGRILMVYGLVALFLGITFARIADRFSFHGFMVGTGGLLAGVGLIPVFFFPTTSGVLIGVLLLGLGQAMSISSQLALVTQVCRPQIEQFGRGPILGFYRLVERLGGAIGPLFAAVLVHAFGYIGAITATGMVIVIAVTLFSVSFLVMGIEPESDDELLPATAS